MTFIDAKMAWSGLRGKMARVMAAAVAGGAGSVLGGGKFANGAITGAFQRLFNDEMHREDEMHGDAESGYFAAGGEGAGADTVTWSEERLDAAMDDMPFAVGVGIGGPVVGILAVGAVPAIATLEAAPLTVSVASFSTRLKTLAQYANTTAKIAGDFLFKPKGLLNNNRYLRIGYGRAPGGRMVFRMFGKVVRLLKKNGHWDIRDLGPW